MKLFVILLFIFLTQPSFAEVVHLTVATWHGCGGKSCYSLYVEKGGMSSFVPKNLYVKDIHLDLYHKKNMKVPYAKIVADHGFWIEDENRWVLVKARKMNSSKIEDYYFMPDRMLLTEAAFR